MKNLKTKSILMYVTIALFLSLSFSVYAISSYSELAKYLPADSELASNYMKVNTQSGTGVSSDGRYFKWAGDHPRKEYTISQEYNAKKITYDASGNISASYYYLIRLSLSEYSDTKYMDSIFDFARENQKPWIGSYYTKQCGNIVDGYACSGSAGPKWGYYTLSRNRGDVVMNVLVKSRDDMLGYTVSQVQVKRKSLAYYLSNLVFSRMGLTEVVISEPSKTQSPQNVTSPPQVKTNTSDVLKVAQKVNNGIADTINKLKNKNAVSNDAQKKSDGMTIFKEPLKKIKLENGKILGNEVKPKIEKTQTKLKDIAQKKNLDIVEIKTPTGKDVKILQKDANIPVKKDESPGFFFKLKYYGNKYVVDKFVDTIADKIPLVGLYKDYFKSEKDANLFSGDKATKKTQLDLGVSKKSAELYVMSGIDDRQKALSPAKNLIPSTPLTKPIDDTLNYMGTCVKKRVANDYRLEYELVKQLATERRNRKESWSSTIKNVQKDIQEQTIGGKTWDGNGRYIPTSYLNTMSKDSGGAMNFKTQSGRLKYYIMKMRESGELK